MVSESDRLQKNAGLMDPKSVTPWIRGHPSEWLSATNADENLLAWIRWQKGENLVSQGS